MNFSTAVSKLNHIIRVSRVEMYKPIQIAETLREYKLNKSINLAELETYRKLSRELRNRVTLELITKVSTSSMRFQDDLWNDSAMPPEALKLLAEANFDHKVEEYIYQHVFSKNSQVIAIRKILSDVATLQDIKNIFDSFKEPGLRSSADRLFEVFALAVLQTQIEKSDYTMSISGDYNSMTGDSGKKLISMANGNKYKLELAKLGHTNAADAGLDIWTNFGVVISVKNYNLDENLFHKVLSDTPVGLLVVICEAVSSKIEKDLIFHIANRPVVLITREDLFKDSEYLLNDVLTRTLFIDKLFTFFDKEFPLTVTLERFMRKRNYKISDSDTQFWTSKFD